MHNFFITGLPRTRSSWLANFLTHGNSFCFHEASTLAPNYIEIKGLLMNRVEEFVGIADSALPFYYEALADSLQNQRLVIINRPLEESYRSVLNWMDPAKLKESKIMGLLERTEKKLDEIRRFDHLEFDFDELNDPQVIEKIWYYCIPGVNFDMDRFELLDGLKVEPHTDKWMNGRAKNNVKSIMGDN